MYNVSDSYKTFIKKPSRSFECRITLGNRVFNNSDIIQIVPTVVQPVDRFSIGNTVSQSIDITLKNDGGVYASVGEIKVEIGLKINNSIEYIPFGTFNIDDVSKTDYTVKLTCYDNMVKFETGYFSKLGNTPTLQEVVNELASITGVEFTGTIPNYTVTKLEGYTCREVLAYVASVCGGNAYITRDNKFTIIYPHEVDCTITADNYFSTGYKLEDQAYKIGMITCQNKSNSNSDSSESDDYDSVNDKNTISVGALSSDSMELTFENPWVTQSILNDIYNKLKNFSYLGYTLKWQGDLSLDPLDIITLVDKNNITRKALVYANKLTYNGGLSAETSAKGETKNSNSFSASGSTNKNIERLSVKLLIAEKAIINKASIADLQANSARIDKLDTNVATINTALIDYANISNATIADLVATKATVSDLSVSVANIDSALINKANVADLTATNATVANLNSDLANVKTLINGNLTSANIHSLVLTSSKVTVDNGFIKNAMIESLDVTKINAGTLNTNKISVSSSDGSLLIAGATQQFKDKNGKVRIQMGQDAQGNFNFILVAGDGTTTLIDGTGVKEKAIADKLIKTNMVADSAIGERQINYSSFITGFNASTNTNFIKASKVAIDLTGQTLDIAFNNMNTTVTSVQTTANTAKSTADTASTNASNAVSTANSANTSASTALSNANSAVDTANTASTNAINAVNTANGANSTANTANTNASNAVTTASSAKSAIDNLQVGGRNYVKGTTDHLILTGNNSVNQTAYPYTIEGSKLAGKTVTISYKWKITSATGTGTFRLQTQGNSQWWSYPSSNINVSAMSGQYTVTVNMDSTASFTQIGIRADSFVGTLEIYEVKIEIGNRSTDWSPAPEDIDQSIASVKTVTETNTTSINAIQGQISTLISNTTITAIDGTTTQLKDAYNGTVNTINSMKTSIGELTTDIDANTKDITSVTSRTSTLETNLSSISATLSSTKSTVDTHTTQISTANTNITTALNNASSAVSTANTANTTANSAKTTATTASTNASNAVTTANSASSNASTALTNSNTAISTANTASTNASNAVSTANKASTDVATLTTTVTNTVSRVSSLELTTNGLTTRVENTETAISNLSIGGRNLIRNSIVDKDISYWSMSFGTRDTNIKFNNHNSVKIRTTGSGYDGIKSNGYTVPFKANTTYTFTIWAYRDSSSSDGNLTKILRVYMPEYKISTLVDYRNYINITSSNLPDKTWTKFTGSFTTKSDSTSFSALQIDYNNVAGTSCVWVSDIKIEEGNQATDWTPAPEDIDSSIQSVKDYATQTINSNVSTINQTTDSIKASVQSLQSSVSTINTTLGNKADSSTVTSVTNRVSTLETGVNGINASITTLNSNVSSITTTANAAKSAIDNLDIGGRNLIISSKTKMGYNIYNSGTATINFVADNTTASGYRYDVTITALGIDGYFNCYFSPSYSALFTRGNGKQYTISFKIKSTVARTWLMRCEANNVSKSVGVTTSYQTVSMTGNSTLSYQALYIFNNSNVVKVGDVISFCDIKFEEGNQATSWTPAPEDIDSQITAVNSSVSSLQSSVSVLQNQIALKVEQSNIDSAVTTINGKIASQNTTISSLQSQINVQAGQISSKVSKTEMSSRNLLPYSGDFTDLSGWIDNGGGILLDTNTQFWNKNTIRTSGNGIQYSGYIELQPNTDYVYSAWVHMATANFAGSLSLRSPLHYWLVYNIGDSNAHVDTVIDANLTVNTGDYWSRCYVHFKTPSNAQMLYFKPFVYGVPNAPNYINIANFQLEIGTAPTDYIPYQKKAIGTIITQSTTEVMTAFNNISRYFQVSADGATFGDFLTGAYTKMSQNGLEHVDSTGATPYHYITYLGHAVVDMGGATTKEVTVSFPSDIITKLNGTVPKGISSVEFYYRGSDDVVDLAGCSITNITSTSITLKAYLGTGKITAYTSVSGSTSATTNVYITTGTNNGSVHISYIIIG
ncbi:putative nucleic acid-binding Zn-ribbon protein [Clostridium beijerinckii]|uniref:beta strand repeat-containing protein n=1 Tax=Clostridium beijerinckii TaxID=1520 RepID=UPI001494392F|nr:hypothetical protein [Clostridium beijerinckii]NOW84271.1 putative nucleic acid-binding Zn-ribbon protein [Clostridium beijerinckii]